jgi:hypothetical protein
MQTIKKKSRILNNNYIKTFTAILKFSKSITDVKLLLRFLSFEIFVKCTVLSYNHMKLIINF